MNNDYESNELKFPFQAYVFVPLGVPGATSGSMFTPVPVEVRFFATFFSNLNSIRKRIEVSCYFFIEFSKKNISY